MGITVEYTDQDMDGSYVALGCIGCGDVEEFWLRPAVPMVMWHPIVALECNECQDQFMRHRDY